MMSVVWVADWLPGAPLACTTISTAFVYPLSLLTLRKNIPSWCYFNSVIAVQWINCSYFWSLLISRNNLLASLFPTLVFPSQNWSLVWSHDFSFLSFHSHSPRPSPPLTHSLIIHTPRTCTHKHHVHAHTRGRTYTYSLSRASAC